MSARPLLATVVSMPIPLGLCWGALILTGFGCVARPVQFPTFAAAPMENVGPIRDYHLLHTVEIHNLSDEHLGRIHDLGIDLENGRIIEVLVETNTGLFTSGKIVAVPPLAFRPDTIDRIYRLDISQAAFAAAPAVDLTDWTAYGRSNRVAAAYRYFGEEPYFVERDTFLAGPGLTPKLMLGYVERFSRIMGLPVTNLAHERLGTVSTLSFDLTEGRVVSIIVVALGVVKTKRVVPPMAFTFNAARDGLILKDSEEAYAQEPQFTLTTFASGTDRHYAQEAYAGPHTTKALPQGNSARDVDITRRIHQSIHAAHIDGENIDVGTLNERVTLRGPVNTDADRLAIAAIAVANSRLELVDNQISVVPPSGP